MVTQYKKENEYPLPDGVKRVISDITEEEITGSRIVNFGRRFGKLRMIWKTERPDVILSFIGKNNMMAILTSRFLHIPVAVSVRQSLHLNITMAGCGLWQDICLRQQMA